MAFKFNPLTGKLDLVDASSATASPDNFSYIDIGAGETVTVPAGQQMLHDGDINVDGVLDVDGEVQEIVDYSDWSFSWYEIPLAKSIKIPVSRALLFVDTLEINGTLTIEGMLIGV